MAFAREVNSAQKAHRFQQYVLQGFTVIKINLALFLEFVQLVITVVVEQRIDFQSTRHMGIYALLDLIVLKEVINLHHV